MQEEKAMAPRASYECSKHAIDVTHNPSMKELYLELNQLYRLESKVELVKYILKVTIVDEDQSWPAQDGCNSYGLRNGSWISFKKFR
jgi:hypothetical protein